MIDMKTSKNNIYLVYINTNLLHIDAWKRFRCETSHNQRDRIKVHRMQTRKPSQRPGLYIPAAQALATLFSLFHSQSILASCIFSIQPCLKKLLKKKNNYEIQRKQVGPILRKCSLIMFLHVICLISLLFFFVHAFIFIYQAFIFVSL